MKLDDLPPADKFIDLRWIAEVRKELEQKSAR